MGDASVTKSSFTRLSLHPKPKTVRIMVLGQEGVGKSALVVRYITKRFIGDYDKNLEKVYPYQTMVEDEAVCFEILDSAGEPQDEGCLVRESNIKWSEVFILMYSVTDKCSFEDCIRLKFLINYNKKRKRLGSDSKDSAMDVPVLLVGNKTDLAEDRMVSKEEGLDRSLDIGCVCFHEISVRESVEQVNRVFRDVFHFWKAHKKFSKLRRSSSESGNEKHGERRTRWSTDNSPLHSSNESTSTLTGNSGSISVEQEESVGLLDGRKKNDFELPPFRNRAQTDGILASRLTSSKEPPGPPRCFSRQRRMSISMKGKNSSC